MYDKILVSFLRDDYEDVIRIWGKNKPNPLNELDQKDLNILQVVGESYTQVNDVGNALKIFRTMIKKAKRNQISIDQIILKKNLADYTISFAHLIRNTKSQLLEYRIFRIYLDCFLKPSQSDDLIRRYSSELEKYILRQYLKPILKAFYIIVMIWAFIDFIIVKIHPNLLSLAILFILVTVMSFDFFAPSKGRTIVLNLIRFSIKLLQ